MYAITVVLYILSGVFYPLHLHNELAYQIKVSLNSSTRSDVRIDLPYDPFVCWWITAIRKINKEDWRA